MTKQRLPLPSSGTDDNAYIVHVGCLEDKENGDHLGDG